MNQEQIIQLKLLSVDAAIKDTADGSPMLERAQAVYEYVAKEALEALAAKAAQTPLSIARSGTLTPFSKD